MEKGCDQCSASQKSMDERESNQGEISDVRIPRYSEREAQELEGKLGNEETFREAQLVLSTWLKEGQCNEKNSAHFYSLIQLCYNRVLKLQTEKKECLENVQKAEESLVNYTSCIQPQLNDIEKAFDALEKENIWDNFTQNQKEKIQEMRIDIFDLKQGFVESKVGLVVEEKETKDVNNEDVLTENVAHKLKTKVFTVNQKSEDPETTRSGCEKEIEKLKLELEESRKRRGDSQTKSSDVASQCISDEFQYAMHLVSLISTRLNGYPNGLSIDSICSYLKNFFPKICVEEIENLMKKCKDVFTPIREQKWALVHPTVAKSLNE